MRQLKNSNWMQQLTNMNQPQHKPDDLNLIVEVSVEQI